MLFLRSKLLRCHLLYVVIFYVVLISTVACYYIGLPWAALGRSPNTRLRKKDIFSLSEKLKAQTLTQPFSACGKQREEKPSA